MKKSLVLMILLVLISGFAFAADGKFSAEYYNKGYYDASYVFKDYANVKATYEAEKYTLDFGVGVNYYFPVTFGYEMNADGEYFFKNTDEETLGVYASFAARHVNSIYYDSEMLALDFSKTLDNGDKFWTAPGGVVKSTWNYESKKTVSKLYVEVPASLYVDREDSAWYFVNVAAAEMPFTSPSDFTDTLYVQAYIKSLQASVKGKLNFVGLNMGKATLDVAFEEILPFEAKGKFTFNHPTEISLEYNVASRKLSNVSFTTELMSGKFNEDILGLNLNEISTNLSFENYVGDYKTAGLNIEFAFDTAKNYDLTVDLDVELKMGSFAPKFEISATYSTKAPKTPYDFEFMKVGD